MDELEQRLARWQAAGLLSVEQADAIRAHERAGGDARADAAGRRRALLAEAVGYVGAALAVGAIALLLGELWDDLVLGGRLALVALLTLLLLGAGLSLRRSPRAGLQRLVSVLLAGATAGAGWLGALVADGWLALDEAAVALVAGLTALALAVPLYALRRRPLPQLTMLAALLIAALAALSLPALPPEPTWYALTVAAIGGAWALLGAGGWLAPRIVAETAGAVVALVALQAGSFEHRLLLLALASAVAAGLVAGVVASGRLHHLAVGAVGLFALVPQLAFEIFGDEIGAPATLLVVGLLLVLLAVGLGRARREVAGERPEHAAPGGAASGPEATERGGRE